MFIPISCVMQYMYVYIVKYDYLFITTYFFSSKTKLQAWETRCRPACTSIFIAHVAKNTVYLCECNSNTYL